MGLTSEASAWDRVWAETEGVRKHVLGVSEQQMKS